METTSISSNNASFNSLKTKINWPIASFLISTPFLAVAGLFYLYFSDGFNLATTIFTIFMVYASGMGITVGYHRFFSHRTFDAHPVLNFIFLFFGSSAFQGSALDWSLDHRRHHRFVDDNEHDPYSINKGFWFAHIGWLLYKQDDQLADKGEAPDLMNDPWVVFQDKHYNLIAAITCFVFPTLVASLWGDPVGGFLMAGLARVVFVQQGTFCINSVCHLFGQRTYSTDHSAKDNWFTALFTFGEGYHNYHHEFASDYRNGIRFYDYDPSKWFIYGMSLLGLTSNLKRISKERILKKKMAVQEEILLEKLAKLREDREKLEIVDFSLKTINNAKEQMQKAYQKLVDLRSQHEGVRQLESVPAAGMELKGAVKNFNKTVGEWKATVSEVNKLIKSNRNLAYASA